MNAPTVPAFVNPLAGGAAHVRTVLARDPRVELHEVEPSQIADAVRAERQRGTPRVIVSGGDGTLSAAIGAAGGNVLEIGIVPGGTLNHFARDYGIPSDPAAALDLALGGRAQPVDVACINGRPMLNTSSVGVYVDFVRRRELLEQRLRYRMASVGAALAVWRDPRAFVVDLRTADGALRRVSTPLVFVGVHERVLERGAPGTLGVRRAGRARALHVLVVNEHAPLRIRSLLVRAIARGIDGLIAEDEIVSYLTTRVVVASAEGKGTIAVDGELVDTTWPLRYELLPDAAMVVRP